MEKRVLLAAALSAIVMLLYAPVLQRSLTPPAQGERDGLVGPDAPAPVEPVPGETPAIALTQLLADEDVVFIDSEEIQLELGRQTASVRTVVFKEFKDLETGEPLQFGGEFPALALLVEGEPLTGEIVESGQDMVVWEVSDKLGNSYNISMEFDTDKSVLHIDLYRSYSASSVDQPARIEIISGWNRGDELGNRYNPLQAVMLTKKDQPWQWRYITKYGTQKSIKPVSRGTYLVTLTERYFCQSLRTDPDNSRVSLIPSPEGSIATRTVFTVPADADGGVNFSTDVYIGTRDHFSLKRAGFTDAFKVGFIGGIGITLLAIMSWLAGITGNYGVAIILFSVMVTCCLAPFTLMSMKSMKKMQQLKPEIDRIMAKQKTDPKKANMDMMALYKEHKVSPLSGCLPMLLQFPVLIALFRSISNYVELRGAGFLWIKDLSLPDRMAQLPFTIPVLGWEYFNLLPIIMTGTMLVQMKMSQQQMPGAQNNPTAKMMSGPFMSIIFGVMFYQFPAGLVLYWMTNSLMTLIFYRVAGRN